MCGTHGSCLPSTTFLGAARGFRQTDLKRGAEELQPEPRAAPEGGRPCAAWGRAGERTGLAVLTHVCVSASLAAPAACEGGPGAVGEEWVGLGQLRVLL